MYDITSHATYEELQMWVDELKATLGDDFKSVGKGHIHTHPLQ